MILTNSTDITVSPLHALSSNDKDWEQWAGKNYIVVNSVNTNGSKKFINKSFIVT